MNFSFPAKHAVGNLGRTSIEALHGVKWAHNLQVIDHKFRKENNVVFRHRHRDFLQRLSEKDLSNVSLSSKASLVKYTLRVKITERVAKIEAGYFRILQYLAASSRKRQ